MSSATSTPRSRAATIGFIVMVLSVSAGMHFDGFGLLLCFVGVLVAASLLAAGLGDFAQQTLPTTGRADGILGMLRGRNLGEGYDGYGTLADDLGAVYDDHGMASEHLCRLLGFVGIGACSVAVNGLAAGHGSPAVAFHLFMVLLGGLFLVIMHVRRV